MPKFLVNAIKEELMNRIVGRSLSHLAATQIGEYKALESNEKRDSWIKENIVGYSTIMKDEWENMQNEYELEDMRLSDILRN